MSSAKPVIEVKDIHKSFGNLDVLKGISLRLNPNENLVLIGRSGSGKSVLIKCIIGLLKPDEGEVHLLNEKVHELEKDELHELRRRIGFLFQHGALYDSMTVEQNLLFPLQKNTAIGKKEMGERVEEALESVGLPETKKKLPNELSGGMQKRIALARAFIMKPEVMFYDEPTAGLDTITSRDMSELIEEMQKKHNVSSIIITHDMASAKAMANRIMVLEEGKVEEEGDYKSLQNSTKEVVNAFFQ